MTEPPAPPPHAELDDEIVSRPRFGPASVVGVLLLPSLLGLVAFGFASFDWESAAETFLLFAFLFVIGVDIHAAQRFLESRGRSAGFASLPMAVAIFGAQCIVTMSVLYAGCVCTMRS